MKKNIILALEPDWWPWSRLWIKPFNEALLECGICSFKHHPNKAYFFAGAVLAKLGLVRNFSENSDKAYIICLNWASETRLFPITYSNEIVPWITDCWPTQFAKWRRIFGRHCFRHVFISARDAIEIFQPEFPEIQFHWLPEAIEPTIYTSVIELEKRNIDVLEMGRQYKDFHDLITPMLRDLGKSHVHGEFLDESVFLATLKNTKIVPCFPKSITDKKHAQQIETVTLRYFQAMMAGCLVIGNAPKELIDLFGYNPVVEVELSTAKELLIRQIEDIGSYQNLVEKNLQRVLEVGTFRVRAQELIAALGGLGYSPEQRS